jgi:CHASE2 domain-containing sensor protein
MSKRVPTGRHQAVRQTPAQYALETIGWGVVTAVLVSLAGWGWHQTEWGEALERYTTDFLQLRLKESRSSDARLKVLVIDIHDWKVEPPHPPGDDPRRGSQTGSAAPNAASAAIEPVTNRSALAQLLRELAQVSPAAIGIDVDFSPDGNDFVSPSEDPDFFDFCRCLTDVNGARVPVYLGVGRQALSPSFRWLGDHKYWDLAAGIMMPAYTSLVPNSLRRSSRERPVPASEVGTPKYDDPASVCTRDRSVAVPQESDAELPSLSYALARAAEPTVVETIHRALAGTERSKEKPVSGAEDYTVSEFWLDNSLVSLARTTSVSLTAGSVTSTSMLSSGALEQARHRVVLIGDRDVGSQDLFTVIDKEQQAAGVFVHAAAVQTLLEKPITSFTARGAFAVDFGMTVSAIFLVALVGYWYGATKKINLADFKRWAIAVGVFGFAVLMVGSWRVLWIDFPLVIAGTLAHENVETFAKRVCSKARVFYKHLHSEVED